jgi:hypothetical protein
MDAIFDWTAEAWVPGRREGVGAILIERTLGRTCKSIGQTAWRRSERVWVLDILEGEDSPLTFSHQSIVSSEMLSESTGHQ